MQSHTRKKHVHASWSPSYCASPNRFGNRARRLVTHLRPPKTSKAQCRKRGRSGVQSSPFWANSVVCIQREGMKSQEIARAPTSERRRSCGTKGSWREGHTKTAQVQRRMRICLISRKSTSELHSIECLIRRNLATRSCGSADNTDDPE